VIRDHPDHAALLAHQIGALVLRQQLEAGILARLAAHEAEEVPLRHERHELAARRQDREIGPWRQLAQELEIDVVLARVRHREQPVQRAELVDQLERRGVHGVAAEVAKEVGVLLEHHHVDARPREQPAQHHPRGATSDDAAARLHAASGCEVRASSRAQQAVSDAIVRVPTERWAMALGRGGGHVTSRANTSAQYAWGTACLTWSST